MTPYRSNRFSLRDELRSAVFYEIEVRSTDTFQRNEAKVVIVVLVVDQKTGASVFMSDPYRLCMLLTRHTGSLFTIGDIGTESRHGSSFSSMLKAFKVMGRVASAQSTTD